MAPEELTLRALFTGAAHGGVHQFGGVRAIIIDAAVVGLSRRLLIDAMGLPATRQYLLRLGYAQGWRSAASLIRLVEPLAPNRFAATVRHLLTLLGMAQESSAHHLSDGDNAITLMQSCEAEEHLRHCGASAEPVCWFTSGFATGYMSRATARNVVCREDQCVASGHNTCRLVIAVPGESVLNIATFDPFTESACAPLLQASEQSADASALAGMLTNDGTSVEHGLGARSSRMRRLLRLADRAADVESTVLITGESGVGKEWLAQYIHRHSRRNRGPFVDVNCGALPETLLENELFGHRRGAFTGALEDRPGLFEAAQGGTIFLDEIGELRLDMQVKLLRVLQEREVRRLGDTRTRPIDVRVIAATNRDLQADVRAGRFRQDLFYRLNVLSFEVPPLRARPDDLRTLAGTLLVAAAREMKRPITGYTSRALARLLGYHWPGNIRELQNVIERACAFAAGPEIDVVDLPEHIRTVATPLPLADVIQPLWQIEHDHILEALRRNGGNRARAAQQLQIATKTLYRRLKQYEHRRMALERVGQNDLLRSS